MQELGGMRMDEVLIAVESYSYSLRIGVALLEEHNKTVLTSQATEYCEALMRRMLESAEDAQTAIQSGRLEVTAKEAGLGQGSDRSHRGGR